MDLIRDVLDKQVIDRDGRRCGRVDGLVAELREGKPPRVAYLEIGLATFARRLGPRIERWVESFTEKRGPKTASRHRIAWERVDTAGRDIDVDLDASRSPIQAWERWLRDHVVARIPG